MSSDGARPRRIVAFDLETTGLSPRTDQIIEIGAVAFDADLRRTEELQLLVDPGMPVPLGVERLTGIATASLAGAASPAAGVARLAEFCEDAPLVAHGGVFDMAFLGLLLPDVFAGRMMFDTLELARILLPTAQSHSLPDLSLALGIVHHRPHRALSDASATGDLFVLLTRTFGGLDRATVGEMRRVAAQAPGPLSAFFTPPAAAAASTDVPRQSMSGARAAPMPVVAAPPNVASMPLGDAAAALLGAGGPLAADPTYELREGQLAMARAVGQTLERRRRLLVEAGTGTGKSLAYLTPLALWAARTKGRAVVATHTITLQEQLAERDLPLVNAMLDTPVPVALLKGRNHYISLRRWARFLAQPDIVERESDVDVIRFKLKVLVWLSQTRTGDRAELHLGAGEDLFWRRIQSDTDDCLGSACANWTTARCHMVAARRNAADAAIVVTNHALLLADSERQGQVLAPYAALVVDEAHQLEAEATRQLGSRLRGADVAAALDRLPLHPHSQLGGELAQCREAARRLFGDVKGYIGERLGVANPGNSRIGLTPDVRDDPGFNTVVRAARNAIGALVRAAVLMEETRGADLVLPDLPQADRGEQELALAAVALRDIAGVIDAVVCTPRDGSVSWLEMRAEQAELHEAPVSVAETLREHVFDRADAAVLTSATLAVAGSFEFLRHRSGIGGSAEELALGSPFDFLGQALCLLPAPVPPYDAPEHDDAIAGLVEDIAARLEGHTLVLFTGYSPLKRVHALLAERFAGGGIAVLGQGLDGTRRQILRSFLDDSRSVLLGTSSFWEGVDIPGERLHCVVIDKLPFPVPTDPLVQARSSQLADPFGQYMLPTAILQLRQGFGRLIRSRADSGAVVLCDERLSTRDYGRRFLEALPPTATGRVAIEDAGRVIAEFIEAGTVSDAVGQSDRWWSLDSAAP